MAVGLQERGGNGPAARRLFDAHTDAVGDLGHAKAAELSNYRMQQQQKSSLPVGGLENSELEANQGLPAGGPPSWYNSAGMQPAKYDMPTVAKERMMAKQAVRRAAGEALEGAPGITCAPTRLQTWRSTTPLEHRNVKAITLLKCYNITTEQHWDLITTIRITIRIFP